MTLPTEANFVVDLLEFEQSFKSGRHNFACLTRPLDHYRYLALAALQSVLNTPALIHNLRKPTHECVADYYEGLYEVITAKTTRHFKDQSSEYERDLVCQYLANLVHFLGLTVIFHYPSLVQEAGRYAAKVTPVMSRDMALPYNCLRIRVSFDRLPTHQPYLPGPDLWNP